MVDPALRVQLAIVGICVALSKIQGHLWTLYELLDDSGLTNDPAECKLRGTFE